VKVYFDMDGVLSDLDGDLAKTAQVPLGKILSDPQFRLGVVKQRVATTGLLHWVGLKPLHPHLWKALMRNLREEGHTLEILTSYGSWDPLEVGPSAHLGKCQWLRQHYGDIFAEGVVTNFNGVETCDQKQFFAAPDSILIDDQIDNIEQFRNAGGKGVWYCGDHHKESLKSLRAALAGGLSE